MCYAHNVLVRLTPDLVAELAAGKNVHRIVYDAGVAHNLLIVVAPDAVLTRVGYAYVEASEVSVAKSIQYIEAD